MTVCRKFKSKRELDKLRMKSFGVRFKVMQSIAIQCQKVSNKIKSCSRKRNN